MGVDTGMRCRVCGLELTAEDKLRNGAYKCPECGTIHETATSSRKSPSPWRKHKSALIQEENPLKRRYLGFPLWSLIVAAVVLVLVIIIIVLIMRKPAQPADESVAGDVSAAATEAVAAQTPGVSASADTVGSVAQAVPEAQVTPEWTVTPVNGSTGTALNDFLVSFNWAMDYLSYDGTLTLGVTQPQTDGTSVQSYSFGDWFDLKLTLAADGTTIKAASSTARLETGSTDTLRVEAAFVCELYGLNNTVSPGACRKEVQAMMADSTRAYGENNFSAHVAKSADGSSYDLNVVGMLQS